MNIQQQINEAPEWLLQLTTESSTSKEHNPEKTSTGLLAGTMYSSGRRHTDFVRQAGLMRRNGSSTELIEMILLQTNKMLPEPLPESEICSIARSMERYEPSHIEDINHKTFADLLLKEQEGKAVYCAGDGFYCYQNNIWEKDIENLLTFNNAIELTDKILAQIEEMRGQVDEDTHEKMKKSARNAQKTPFLMSALQQYKAKKSIRIKFDELNPRKELLIFRNCVLNTETLATERHSPKHLSTWMIDANYDPAATCSNFDKYLDDVLPKDTQRLLLQLIASSLTASKKEQRLAMLIGEKQNGKSTFIKIMQETFGCLCANVEPSSLMAKTGDHIPNDIARLASKRLVFTSETKLGNILDAPLMKRMSGGDVLTARFLGHEFFEFTPEFTIFIMTNYLPVIDGSDEAMHRRLVLIPFDRIIPDNLVDKSLKDKLRQEKSGIINRIVVALKDYQENGLVIPAEIQERVNKYMDSSNLIKRFFDECLERSDNDHIGARELYQIYSGWSEGYRVKPLSEPQFKIIFERATRIMQIYNSRRNLWPGLRLRRS